MKKFFAIAAALLIATAALAQETNRDENGNLKFGGYETNGLWDNWVVGLGWNIPTSITRPIYIPHVIGDMPKFSEFFDHFPLGMELFALKWVDPCFGVRFGYTGFQTVVAPQQAVCNLNYFHVDILWNICNAWWGYKEGRKFEVSPYFTLSPYMRGSGILAAGAGAGIYGTYFFNSKWGLFADFGGIISDAKLARNPYDNYNFLKFEFGIARNLGKSNWKRVASSAGAAAAAIAAANAAKDEAESKVSAAQDAAAAAQQAQQEAEQLRDEFAKAAAKGNYEGLFDEPVVVYFEIGKSKLTSLEKAHAEYAIKNIISRGENVKFTLSGSADTGTGSKKRNKQLSEERAKTVYKLVDELGVNRDNITVVEWDGTDRFPIPELNRAVIIEKQ